MKYAPNVKQQTEETRKLLEDLRVKVLYFEVRLVTIFVKGLI